MDVATNHANYMKLTSILSWFQPQLHEDWISVIDYLYWKGEKQQYWGYLSGRMGKSDSQGE